MISVYMKSTEIELNIRRLESIERYNKLIQWGRANPAHFIELIFKVSLIDYQKWVLLNTWAAEHATWVCARNAGKTFLGALYLMARSTLFPNIRSYILSYTAFQAQETFGKMKDIATKNIASLTGLSDVFFNETIKSQNNKDGFILGKSFHETTLYNGSTVMSLVGKAENIVGLRSNVNFYDEAGKISNDFFALTRPFTTQSTDFVTGKGFDARVYPKNVPTQNIYASSAENVSTELWERYKDCYKHMMMGIPGFFCADINCEMPLNPYIDGEPTGPLLKQSEIDAAMRVNESKALREYYNIFDTAGGSDAAVPRVHIIKSEKLYVPYASSRGPDRQYVLLFDPAHKKDNSFILIAEIYRDKEQGYKARVVNGVNLIEQISPTEKKILSTPEQVEWLRKLILAYNGNAFKHGNVEIYIDAGPGGGGRSYGDYLMLDWKSNGVTYHGLFDGKDEMSKQQQQKFPNAVDRLHLMEPTKYKALMYGALSEMMSQELIDLPVALPLGGELKLEDETVVALTKDESRAMAEIDLMKEEIMNVQKIELPSGGVSYRLPSNKELKMSDDRSYCLAMLGWHLSELRRKEMTPADQESSNFADYMERNKEFTKTLLNKSNNPFQGVKNPFAQRGGNSFQR